MLRFSALSMVNNQFQVKQIPLDSENIGIFFTDCENWAMDQMLIIDPKNQMPPDEAHDEYRHLVELCDSHGG